jgi:hypothetical protein
MVASASATIGVFVAEEVRVYLRHNYLVKTIVNKTALSTLYQHRWGDVDGTYLARHASSFTYSSLQGFPYSLVA